MFYHVFVFLIIHLYFLIHAVIGKNFAVAAEFEIHTGTLPKEAKEKIEIH